MTCRSETAAATPLSGHDPCACFGARLDLVGTLRDALPVILELKTGKMVHATFALQTAGELLAYCGERTSEGLRPGRMVLQLRDDGTFDRTRDLHEHTDPRDFRAVLTAARHYHERRRYGLQESAAHAHTLHRHDGVRVPGINTVLAAGGYVDLAAIPPAILERARQRGERVHRIVEAIVAGREPGAATVQVLATEVPEDTRGVVEGGLLLYVAKRLKEWPGGEAFCVAYDECVRYAESFCRARDALRLVVTGSEVEAVYACDRAVDALHV